MSHLGFFAGQRADAAPASDPYWSSVVLLLHCDGADGATELRDSSSYGRALTAGGAAALTTGRARFGAAALNLSDGGSSSIIRTPDDGGFSFGAGSWTVECWMQYIGGGGTRHVLGKWRTAGRKSWGIFLVGNTLYVSRSDNGTTTYDDIGVSTSFAANTWYHIAADYDASAPKLRLYKDGVMIGSHSTARTLSSASGEPFTLGGSIDTSNPNRWTGYLDEVRITKGIARYASDAGFTVPPAPYPNQ